MTEKLDKIQDPSRRKFLEKAGIASMAIGTGTLTGVSATGCTSDESGVQITLQDEPQSAARATNTSGGPYNILFILTDQERYFDPSSLPADYRLPGRERMRREGISFTNHQIATSVCSSSRSVIYTGQHIQHTGVFDNLGLPWSKELSPEMPTVGNYLNDAGYHASYLGKCHFVDALEEIEVKQAPVVNLDELNKIMLEYGFNDYVGVGDIIGMTKGGYKTDEFTTSTAIRWLRSEPQQLAEQGIPWYLALNLVNPHDVMFYNTDARGDTAIQESGSLLDLNREPPHALYQKKWDMPLSASRNEQFEQEGRPGAHYDYQYARRALVGQFPGEDSRWKRLQDYYLNCIADCDQHVNRILQELDDLGLAENTIVVMTSDHGELAGAHGMHGKGATTYAEQLHVPLWIRHPAYAANAGQECKSLTSHLDITPTILGMAGVSGETLQQKAPALKGKDISGLLASPTKADLNSVRNSALYNYNMWLYIDADFMGEIYKAKSTGQDPATLNIKPDLTKRGAIRSVTDGRYRFSRYFSPLQHNLPVTVEEIRALNDVELYDLEADPSEMKNLAVDVNANGDLMLAMNQKLANSIEYEVGSDEGEFLPDNKNGWAITKIDP